MQKNEILSVTAGILTALREVQVQKLSLLEELFLNLIQSKL